MNFKIYLFGQIVCHKQQFSRFFNKTNKVLDVDKRTVKHGNVNVMVQLCKSSVRTHLTCCSPAWSPIFLSRTKNYWRRFSSYLSNY